jgi:nucleotide-binding universal stress UspA family protein
MSKILIAIDGSPASLRAANFVATHPQLFPNSTEMTLIHVHLPIPSPRAIAWVGADVVNKYYDEDAEAALTPARELLQKAGRTFLVEKQIGDPGHKIAMAAGNGYQLIVMGTHGRTALGNLAMGSVATRTVAESAVPVLLVK